MFQEDSTLLGQQEQDCFWNQHSLLGMGSCSVLAIQKSRQSTALVHLWLHLTLFINVETE